jgi:TolB-like protein
VEQRFIRTILRKGVRFVGAVREESGTGAMVALELPQASLRLPDRPSIALLPFVNMSGDPEQDYFADGMVEDIIAGLSRIKWLFVIARNSSFAYRGRAVDVKQVGRDLGVRYVLEGSVRKSANRVRISAQLIEAENGHHLWAERYDRDLTDVFSLQDEITIRVVAAIEPNLRQAEIERVRRKRPHTIDAYDLLLRALPNVYTCMPEGAGKGLLQLEQALAIEPTYALAHGFAAWAHEIIYVFGGMQPENYEKSIRHAHAAIENGPGDAMALAFAGFTIGMVEHDRELADEAFERGVGAEPILRLRVFIRMCPSGVWRRRRARRRLGSARDPSQPARRYELHSPRHHWTREFPARPPRECSRSRSMGRSIEPGFQHLARMARGAAREARTTRRSKSCERPALGA